MTFVGRQTTDQQLINHLYETSHETYRIREITQNKGHSAVRGHSSIRYGIGRNSARSHSRPGWLAGLGLRLVSMARDSLNISLRSTDCLVRPESTSGAATPTNQG